MSGDHHYVTTTSWRGSTAVGYEHYDRAHTATVPPVRGALDLTSDPAFRGDPSRLNPEHLLVLAASSCQLLAFLAVAARARIDVIEYDDDASAVMPEADLWITQIVLRPRVAVVAGADGPTRDRIEHLMEVAHRECFVARSLRSEVVVEPSVELRDRS